MYTTTDTARSGGIRSSLGRAESWLDRKGKPAWIVAMVAGFILFWPLGLALLAYMIWGKQMFGKSCNHRRAHDHSWGRHGSRATQSSGNSAFDSYKGETLRRLEDEQTAFETFLQRLRNSKDKTEFDAFMEDRAKGGAPGEGSNVEPAATTAQNPRAGEY